MKRIILLLLIIYLLPGIVTRAQDTPTPTPTETPTPTATATSTPTITPTYNIWQSGALEDNQGWQIEYSMSAGDLALMALRFIIVGLLVFLVFLILLRRR